MKAKTLVPALTLLTTGCGVGDLFKTEFKPVQSCQIQGVTIDAEVYGDCECFYRLIDSARSWNRDKGIAPKHLDLKGVTFRWRNIYTFEVMNTEVSGVYDPLGPTGATIEVASDGHSMAHELLHLYNNRVRHRNPIDEIKHSDWDENGWRTTTQEWGYLNVKRNTCQYEETP
jgi:hypothetical protein